MVQSDCTNRSVFFWWIFWTKWYIKNQEILLHKQFTMKSQGTYWAPEFLEKQTKGRSLSHFSHFYTSQMCDLSDIWRCCFNSINRNSNHSYLERINISLILKQNSLHRCNMNRCNNIELILQSNSYILIHIHISLYIIYILWYINYINYII